MKQLIAICVSFLAIHTHAFAMKNILAEDYSLEMLINEEQISSKIKKVAVAIDNEYNEQGVVIIGVLKGSVCIVADLMRQLKCPHSVEFIHCSSYGIHGHIRGELTVKELGQLQVEGKHVLIVDDIFDSGNTLATVVNNIKEKRPSSIKSLVLLSKNIHREISYKPDYALFEIGNDFVVGYGLDYKECFRGLKAIYKLNLKDPSKRLNGSIISNQRLISS